MRVILRPGALLLPLLILGLLVNSILLDLKTLESPPLSSLSPCLLLFSIGEQSSFSLSTDSSTFSNCSTTSMTNTEGGSTPSVPRT
mmetsp:Transcript_10801/g.14452  ORF Transcript_10801/g.14452 Transcript_10801/m.14452 type:complete len:86 (+) Transcript_10801:561-818(+)